MTQHSRIFFLLHSPFQTPFRQMSLFKMTATWTLLSLFRWPIPKKVTSGWGKRRLSIWFWSFLRNSKRHIDCEVLGMLSQNILESESPLVGWQRPVPGSPGLRNRTVRQCKTSPSSCRNYGPSDFPYSGLQQPAVLFSSVSIWERNLILIQSSVD